MSNDDNALPLVVGRDPRTLEHCLVACAAAGVVPSVQREPDEVRRRWSSAPVVVVAVEMAAQLAGLGLPNRSGVHLVGPDGDELLAWSAPLAASALVLPEQTGLLTSLVASGRDGVGEAHLVVVSGGSGGVGASTLACGLAQVAARRGLRSAVVDLAPLGGGLDLVFGAETAPGWRWPDLAAASGHVDDLTGRLVNVSGVDVVSTGRAAGQPSAEAARAVVASLTRTHELVVLDLAAEAAISPDCFAGALHLLLCGADVRQAMAARARVEAVGWRQLSLVVRRGPGRRVEPGLVAETLGLELFGVVDQDARVVRQVELGEPPGRGRGRFARQLGRLLDEVTA